MVAFRDVVIKQNGWVLKSPRHHASVIGVEQLMKHDRSVQVEERRTEHYDAATCILGKVNRVWISPLNLLPIPNRSLARFSLRTFYMIGRTRPVTSNWPSRQVEYRRRIQACCFIRHNWY